MPFVHTILSYRSAQGIPWSFQSKERTLMATKEARLNLRLREGDDELIRLAAERTGQSVTQFLTSSAVDRAHEVLADQRTFVLDEATWDAFVALLADPPRPDPRLVELFARPKRITG
jgi:uncharacterized protein (DUF1778 family)